MYSLKTQARCLVAHAGDEERHAFLVGTANLRGPNEVRLLRYYAEDEELSCAAVWAHEGPVTALAACPTDAALLLTSTISPSGAPSAAVWRLRDLPGDAGPGGRHSEAAVDAGEATRELEVRVRARNRARVFGRGVCTPRAVSRVWPTVFPFLFFPRAPVGSAWRRYPRRLAARACCACSGCRAAATTRRRRRRRCRRGCWPLTRRACGCLSCATAARRRR
jgi:hypothetical protein